MTATEAVSAPRIYAGGEMVYVEHRIREATCEMLIRMGHRIDHLMQSYASDFSRPQMVKILDNESLDGGSDPRGGGRFAYSR
ncbi:hypothetical protein FIM12_01290 [SAR202 cluster bacterium AD-804-J14_MRT_500m]|nr:hypothetical protein [SAR202 cluster bacterium AD-804-J14_MRT_500m]